MKAFICIISLLIFANRIHTQTEVTKNHFAIRPGFGISNYENHLRTSISTYFKASKFDVLDETDYLDSPIIPSLSLEFAPPTRNYFIQFRYQPLFFNYNFRAQIEYYNSNNDQTYFSRHTDFSLAFQNNSYSIAAGQMFFPDSPVNIRIYGGASYNTSRTIFRQVSVSSKSAVGFTPGVLAGFELGFGKVESPFNLRFYVQQQLSGKTQIEGNNLLIEITELNSTKTIYLQPALTHFSYLETGIYLSMKLQ
jgi:hypothetical protein